MCRNLHWNAYARLMRLDKPIGTFLLLWPTLWALWIASHGFPSLKLLFIFSFGVFIMRSAGCIVNDMADRNFDPHVERTAKRPLACAEVSLKEAFILLSILLIIALILVLFLNLLCFKLACVGLFITIIYPFMKRYIVAPQCVLGIAFSLGIPMAFAAVDGNLSHLSWLLWTIGILSPIIYDTLYALVDKEDDLKIGIHSTAILLGENALPVITILETIWFILWIILGWQYQFNFFFYLSVLIATAIFFYHERKIKTCINTENKALFRMNCFNAFLAHAWIGGVLFLGIVLG